MKSALLDFDVEDRARIAWENEGRFFSYGDCLAAIELNRAWIRSEKLEGIHAIHGYAPFDLWLWTLAAWAEGLCVAPLSGRLPLSQYQASLAQLPAHGILDPERSPQTTSAAKSEADVQLIIFSSGSTGMPKAIGHCLRSLMTSARASNDFYRFQKGDRWLLSLDLSHIGGLQIAMRCWLQRGVCVYAGEPKDVGSILSRNPVDFVSLVPTQLYRCLGEPSQLSALKRCKAILLGGAAASDDLIRRAEAAELPVSITYGCTEAASQIAAFPPGYLPKRANSVGEVLPLWDLEETASGLQLHGSALFAGHWQQGEWVPRATFVLPDQGRVEGRSLSIEGRKDQIFQVGAENLSPEEILAPLRKHGLIEDAVVLSKDDPDFGKLPLLVIRGPKAPAIGAIQSLFEETLVPVKRPREIWWHASDDVSKPSKALYEEWVFDPKGDKGDIKRLWAYARQDENPGL